MSGNNCVSPEMPNFQKPPEVPLRCFLIPSKRENHLQISSKWWSAIDRFIIGVPGQALFINIYVCHLNIVNCPPPTQQQPSSVPQTCNIESLLQTTYNPLHPPFTASFITEKQCSTISPKLATCTMYIALRRVRSQFDMQQYFGLHWSRCCTMYSPLWLQCSTQCSFAVFWNLWTCRWVETIS